MQTKKSIITLYKGKLVSKTSHEKEICEFILYNRDLGDAVTCDEIIHMLWNIDERYQEKSWSTLQSGDIVYCIEIVLHLVERQMLHKTSRKLFR